MKTEFQQEKDRVTMLRELLQLSQTEFSRRIGISQGALSQIESGRSRLSMETLKNLSTEFNINCNWLVNGKGDIFYSPKGSSAQQNEDNFIPLINKSAKAGYPKGYSNDEYIKTLDFYKIPDFENGDYRMFEIEGDSMVPTFYPGEIVIARHVTDFSNLEDKGLFVILHFKNLQAKRVSILENQNAVEIISDNPEYPPEKLKYKDIKEMWQIKGKISKEFFSEHDVHSNKIKTLEYKLQLLQGKVDKLMS